MYRLAVALPMILFLPLPMQSIVHAITGRGHVSHVSSLVPMGAASQDGKVTKIMLMLGHHGCWPGVIDQSSRASIWLIFRQTDANQGC